MRHTNTIGIILLALFGAVITTFCDGVHVHTQTLSYPNPFLFGQAWWVYPGFVMAFLTMECACLLVVNHLPAGISTQESVSKGNMRELIETVTTFILIYLLSGFGNFDPFFLFIIFYVIFIARWMFTYDKAWLLLLAFLMAIGGMFAEGVLAAAGLVTYRHVDIFHVPFWLGGLYVHGAFALREGLRLFVYNSPRNEMK
jgi:hypothetical protein